MRTVPSVGPINANIILVGEAPGAEEDRRGQPFVGPAGNILNNALKLAGLNRMECRITNVISFRPPSNDFTKVTPEQLQFGKNELRKEIERVKPNVIVALGTHAIEVLTGKIGSTKWRGSVIPCVLCEGYKVLCTEHPAFLLPMRRPEDFHLLVFDLERAKEEMEFNHIREFQKDMIINPTFDIVTQHLLQAYDSNNLVVDIETDRKVKSIWCVGISYKSNHAICIPFRYQGQHYWSLEQETFIWHHLQQLLVNHKSGKIGQNMSFDATILYKWVGEIYPVVIDTMLAHHTLHIEDPHGLDHLVSVFTHHPYHKDAGKSWDEQCIYNCTDCITTWDVALAEAYELKEEGLENFFYGFVMPLWRIVWRMERFGIKIDMKIRDKMKILVESEIEKDQKKLDEHIGYSLNVNSRTQMRKFLYEDLKLPLKRHYKTKRITADATAIEQLALKYPNKAFDLVLGLRSKIKTLGTYLEAGVDNDGRMRTSYLVSGTDTGRLSSRKNIFGSGMDLQNIPEKLRKPFICDENKILMDFDLSQAENSVVAYLADEERQIKLLNSGGDFHSTMAGWLGTERILAKKVIHGTNYGMKKRLLAQITGLEEKVAEEIRQRYFEECPGIEHWHRSIQMQLKENRTLITPLGRKRVFWGLMGDSTYRKAYAYLPQSTVADWLNINMICIALTLGSEVDILLQVHDSMLLQVNLDTQKHVYLTVKHLLERSFKVNGRMLSITCKCKVGINWGELEEYDGE